nr:MAG TPA: STRUCTURAL MAINTENANCE OF CHROMOSOMES PROTEIN [Caudoviricetes sp.]
MITADEYLKERKRRQEGSGSKTQTARKSVENRSFSSADEYLAYREKRIQAENQQFAVRARAAAADKYENLVNSMRPEERLELFTSNEEQYSGARKELANLLGQERYAALKRDARNTYIPAQFGQQILDSERNREYAQRYQNTYVPASLAEAAIHRSGAGNDFNAYSDAMLRQEYLNKVDTNALQAELDALNDQAQQSRRELDALEHRAADLRQQTAQWQALAAQEQADACQQAAQAALTAQARADTLAADCAALPDDASLTLLEGQAAALPGELSTLTEKRSAAEKAAQTAQQAKKALEQHPLYPAAEPELRQRAEAIQPDRTPSLLLVLFPASLIVVAAALAFLFQAQQPLPFWLFIGMAGLGMIATLFAARSRRQAIVERHKYAETQRAALETQIAEYLPLRQQADEAAEAARRAEVSAADSEDACRRRLRDLLTQVRVFAPAAADLSGIQLALSDARRRKTALADARQTAREAALYRDALRVQLPEQPAAESSIQRPALSREEAAAELARTQTLLAQERTRFDTLTGRIRALDRSSDLEAQLAQKQEQLTALQDEYDAIALAMDALSQANTVLQNRFSPALGARAAEIFSAITGGRYDRVLLSRDFSLSAEPVGDPVGRSVRLLSQGAADQLYLAVRLAICDMVLPADKRVPLILDDALVTFDDERLHAALDYLLEESQRRQILLFTCQKREMAYLQGKENVTVTKL